MDKKIEHLLDAKSEGVSDCCGASVYMDICSDCKEHCFVVYEEEPKGLDLGKLLFDFSDLKRKPL